MAVPMAKTESFPSTMHRMLTEIDHLADRNESKLREIISWQQHGMAFKIHNRQKFRDIVMPIWFSRLKYCSWVRQLNSFGFKRVQTEGKDKGALYHEGFVRGAPDLAAQIDKPKRGKIINSKAEMETSMNAPLSRVVSSGSACNFSMSLPDQSQSQCQWAYSPRFVSATMEPMALRNMMVHRNRLAVLPPQPSPIMSSWQEPQASLPVNTNALHMFHDDSLEPLNIFDGMWHAVLDDEDNGICPLFGTGSTRDEFEDMEPLNPYHSECEPEKEQIGQFAYTIVHQN